MNDQLLKAALPAIEKFAKPLIEDAKGAVRGLLLGPCPPNLLQYLSEELKTDQLEQDDANAIWTAVGKAVQHNG
jgi:hypothetical protein